MRRVKKWLVIVAAIVVGGLTVMAVFFKAMYPHGSYPNALVLLFFLLMWIGWGTLPLSRLALRGTGQGSFFAALTLALAVPPMSFYFVEAVNQSTARRDAAVNEANEAALDLKVVSDAPELDSKGRLVGVRVTIDYRLTGHPGESGEISAWGSPRIGTSCAVRSTSGQAAFSERLLSLADGFTVLPDGRTDFSSPHARRISVQQPSRDMRRLAFVLRPERCDDKGLDSFVHIPSYHHRPVPTDEAQPLRLHFWLFSALPVVKHSTLRTFTVPLSGRYDLGEMRRNLSCAHTEIACTAS
jgi:hypothetical protein